MPLMFLSATILLHFVAGLDWPLSLLLGAILAPTDPVLAGSIVRGARAQAWLPQRIRDAISFESGVNDGLAFPLVMLCLLLLMQAPADAWRQWLTTTLLWQTGGAMVWGLLCGYIAGRLMRHSLSRDHCSGPAIPALALTLAFFILASLQLMAINSILAVFVAGVVLNSMLAPPDAMRQQEVVELAGRLFTLPVFVLFGLLLPWQQWIALGWKAPALAALILLLRRLPFVLAARPLLRRFALKDLWLIGWFGPMGVGALFYCFYSYEELHETAIWTYASLIVCSSVLVHGMSAEPLLRWYGRSVKRAKASLVKDEAEAADADNNP